MAGTNNTPFTPNMDTVAQMSGTGAPFPFTTAVTYVSGGNTDPTSVLFVSSFASITTASGNTTVLMPTLKLAAGARRVIQINNDATAARTVTFSTGFRANGAITGTNSKAILIDFVSDGTTLNEVARTGAALT